MCFVVILFRNEKDSVIFRLLVIVGLRFLFRKCIFVYLVFDGINEALFLLFLSMRYVFVYGFHF